MSTPGEETPNSGESKFTRGEKCIFVHTIITFCIILLLVIIYFIHLCVVSHSLQDLWRVSLRSSSEADNSELDDLPVGLIYINDVPIKYICNSLLLKERWSVGPGHCAAMRTDPEMSNFLMSWRVKYKREGKEFIGSEIKRTIPHPHFDSDDFRNNIGLFEHGTINFIAYYDFPTNVNMNDDTLGADSKGRLIVGWTHNCTVHEAEHSRPDLTFYAVKPVTTAKCVRFMAPILELRPYEFCALIEHADGIYPEHGSLFIVDSNILGMFTWGERSGKGSPSIILNLGHFKNWLQNIIAWI